MQDDELAELRHRVDDLTDIVRNLIETCAHAKEPPHPQRWAERATDDDWRNLITWVKELNETYSLR